MAIKLWDLAGAEDDRRFSPYCWRVKMALMHKGLAFDTVPWRFHEKDALAFSGQALVPVIMDGGNEVHDSWTIATYLDQAYPDRSLLFGSDEARTLALLFRLWVERSVHPLLLKAVVMDLYDRLHDEDKAYFRETREKRFGMTLERYGADPQGTLASLRTALDPARPVLGERPFFSGRASGFADYALFGAFQWSRAISPLRLLESDDPLYAWRERMLDLFGGYARAAKS
ncbi:MAG TPA: glutathione S-transferase N-terminal domain-containing protein [Burkholderiales bacterium]|nr:glutathione S-transferase N-terminal domain-containing protein [Burkholderiales bacterium]